MAEIPMSGQGGEPEQAPTIGTLVNWLGAAASLALVAGTSVWGYKLLVRDVSGVPVVRAVEGPMRVQPDDPGGRQAAHQGLSVNAVAADGSAAPPADRLVLAPAPIDIDENDTKVRTASVPAVETTTVETVAANDPSDIVAPPPLDTDKIEAIEAFADQIAASVAPLANPDAADAPAVKVTLDQSDVSKPTTETETKVVFTNGVSHSLRPKLRPEGLGARETQVASVDASVPAARPTITEANAIPVGTHLVQLGAFASEEIAAAEWDKMTARFSDYLGTKTRVIQQATSGGRVFYRLRAMGFTDLSDARRLCSALKAERADCIPVTVR